MANNDLDQLMKAAMAAAGDENITGVVVTRKNNESTAQFHKFAVIMAQVYSRVAPYVDPKKSYDWDSIIQLVKDANLLSLRVKKQSDTGKSVISNGDAISIIESTVWAISRLQTGIALPVAPAICDECEGNNSIWDCIVRIGCYRDGQLYEPLKSYFGEECHIVKIGETSIGPYELKGE